METFIPIIRRYQNEDENEYFFHSTNFCFLLSLLTDPYFQSYI